VKKVAEVVGALLLVFVGLSACATDEPTASDFCEAVARIPAGSTVGQAQSSMAKVEENSPPEIRDDVAVLRTAIDKASTESDLNVMDERGGRVEAATTSFEAYVAEHCASAD
jgi:hypothetical protein